MDTKSTTARSTVAVELRIWDANTATTTATSTTPRIRHLSGDISWEKLHQIAYTTFSVDRASHTVHFHRDSFRDGGGGASPTSGGKRKPRLKMGLWAAGVYHGVALRIRGDRKFVIYAHFVKKDEYCK
ncbi:hypothetical protein DIS24_g8596 [Lasiodiplodia hormozganensis]|uniref:Uncharacterized protein n=1 Tax=Lasiodiplodia hormozganensis TaxID=869390 RepID=A0AA40CN98_9PEZI|nr:hypothetical protein DIS24_g8596 [Lasiodiplodia hormozganensis]